MVLGSTTFTVHYNHSSFFFLEPITHTGHHIGYQCERGRVMIREWIVPYSAIDLFIWISGSLCSKFPNSPVLSMFLVQETHQLIQGVSICHLWPCSRGPRCCNNWRIVSFSFTQKFTHSGLSHSTGQGWLPDASPAGLQQSTSAGWPTESA
jgi:hypothetical protein